MNHHIPGTPLTANIPGWQTQGQLPHTPIQNTIGQIPYTPIQNAYPYGPTNSMLQNPMPGYNYNTPMLPNTPFNFSGYPQQNTPNMPGFYPQVPFGFQANYNYQPGYYWPNFTPYQAWNFAGNYGFPYYGNFGYTPGYWR